MAALGVQRLNLPWPVTGNANTRAVAVRVGRKVVGRQVKSRDAKAYRDQVRVIAMVARPRIICTADLVSVRLFLRPKRRVDGQANERRPDLGNLDKVLSDALEGIAWDNDRQIEWLDVRVGSPVEGGGINLFWWPFVGYASVTLPDGVPVTI